MEPEGSLPHSQKPPPIPILCQLDSVHALTFNYLKFHLNILLPSTPGSSKWYLSLGFHLQTPVYTSPDRLHAPPIPFFSNLSPEQYWVRGTDYKLLGT